MYITVKSNFTTPNQVKNSLQEVIVSLLKPIVKRPLSIEPQRVYNKVQTTNYTQEHKGQIRLFWGNSLKKENQDELVPK